MLTDEQLSGIRSAYKRWLDNGPYTLPYSPLAQSDVGLLLQHVAEQDAEIARLRDACVRQAREVEQTLGRALGFPRYADDPANFPEVAPDDPRVFVGEYVAETLARMAADRIRSLDHDTKNERPMLTEGDLENIRAAFGNWREHTSYAIHGRSAYADVGTLLEHVAAQNTEIERLTGRLHNVEHAAYTRRCGCGQKRHVGSVPSPEATSHCETCRAMAAEAESAALRDLLDSGVYQEDAVKYDTVNKVSLTSGHWRIELLVGAIEWRAALSPP